MRKVKIFSRVLFRTEEEFARYVRNLTNLSKKTKEDLIEHELAHARMAISLGYSPTFEIDCVSRITYSDFAEIPPRTLDSTRAFVKLYPPVLNIEHLRQIVSAPENLSEDDIKMLENL